MAERFEDLFPESVRVAGRRRETARQEFAMRKRILGAFRDGPKTVPEIAKVLGLRPHEATWWIMGYVRYGYLRATEGVTDEGYYRYALVEGK